MRHFVGFQILCSPSTPAIRPGGGGQSLLHPGFVLDGQIQKQTTIVTLVASKK